MNIYVALGIGLVVSVALIKSHYEAYNYGVEHQIVEQAKVDDLIKTVKEDAMIGAADAISKISIKQVTIKGRLEKEIQTNTVYRECVHTPDGLRAINDALTNSESGSVDHSELPPSSPAK